MKIELNKEEIEIVLTALVTDRNKIIKAMKCSLSENALISYRQDLQMSRSISYKLQNISPNTI